MKKALLAIAVSVCTGCVFAQKTEAKLSPALLLSYQSRLQTDSITVSVALKDFAYRIPYAAKQRLRAPGYITCRIHIQDLALLLKDEQIVYVNETHEPKEELATGAVDYTLNAVTYAQAQFPALRADSLSVMVKERRMDTTDIDLRQRVIKTGYEDGTVTAHASLMATIIAGTGNSAPIAKGTAIGAKAGSVSFSNLFPESDSFYNKHSVRVVNHSYGTVVENFYGNEAAAYDRSANANAHTLFVFSAGNAGSVAPATGTYQNLNGFANLTGNFKQTKNSLTVGSTDSLNRVLAMSSGGPSFDGRIKPELVAYGEDGSSGAAALVSGAALLVTDAYRKESGTTAPAHLLKAILLNSADDVGTLGPDYRSGFGSLNVFNAVQTIRQQRYFQNSVQQGEIKNFSLTIPANAARVKFTLAWNDPASPSGAAKTLVNNIDASLQLNATGQSWQPWILSCFPHADSLNAPARRGLDTVNNMEQISIANPAAGNYTLQVRGAAISGSQTFAIAYQVDTLSTYYFTYPSKQDALPAGSKQVIRWHTTDTVAATLSYATAGNNWRTITTIPRLSAQQASWIVPDTVTTAVVRLVVAGTNRIVVSDTFTISPQLQMQTAFDCVDSFSLQWNAMPNVSYQLFHLDGKYLSPVLQTTDTSVVLRASASPYYAVAPLINGRPGLRSNTLKYNNSGVGCYLQSFFVQTQTENSVTLALQMGSLAGVQEIVLQKMGRDSFSTLQRLFNPAALQFSFTDNNLKQGENLYRTKIVLRNGFIVYSQTETVYHVSNFPALIYPNPATRSSGAKIIVQESGRFHMRVLNGNGQLVWETSLNKAVTELPAVRWQTGLYFVSLHDKDGKVYTQKIMVQ
jgi:hypothetical protein